MNNNASLARAKQSAHLPALVLTQNNVAKAACWWLLQEQLVETLVALYKTHTMDFKRAS